MKYILLNLNLLKLAKKTRKAVYDLMLLAGQLE